MALDRQTGRASNPSAETLALIVKRFDRPEQLLVFDSGRLEVITVGGRAIGKGSYAPGWRWSRCATQTAPLSGGLAEPVGVVLSGQARFAAPDGEEVDLHPGDLFQTPTTTTWDEWVVGQRPCEILYLSGVEALIRRLRGPD